MLFKVSLLLICTPKYITEFPDVICESFIFKVYIYFFSHNSKPLLEIYPDLLSHYCF